jgi:hypothetical protein
MAEKNRGEVYAVASTNNIQTALAKRNLVDEIYTLESQVTLLLDRVRPLLHRLTDPEPTTLPESTLAVRVSAIVDILVYIHDNLEL